MDSRRLERVTDFVEAQLGSRITLDELASAAALSRFHFVRSFKITTGMSPGSFVASRRICRSQLLLVSTDEAIHAIARSVGFTSSSHFRRQFKTHTGIGPSAYRECFR